MPTGPYPINTKEGLRAAQGANPVSISTGGAGTTTLTRDQLLSGKFLVIHNAGATAARTIALPSAEPGMGFIAIVKANFDLRLDPAGTETIAQPSTGVQAAAGKYMAADAVGESYFGICTVAGQWDHVGANDGTWTAEV